MDLSVNDVIDRLGGNQAVAAAVGAVPNSVYYWRVRRRIPLRYRDTLLRLASEAEQQEITGELLVRLAMTRGRPLKALRIQEAQQVA